MTVNIVVSGQTDTSGVTLYGGDSLLVLSGGVVTGGAVAAVYGTGGPSTVDNEQALRTKLRSLMDALTSAEVCSSNLPIPTNPAPD